MVNFNRELYIKAWEQNYSGSCIHNFDLRLLTAKMLNKDGKSLASDQYVYNHAKEHLKDMGPGLLVNEEQYNDLPGSDKVRLDVYNRIIVPLRWALEHPNETQAKEIIKLQKDIEQLGVTKNLTKELEKMNKNKSSKMRKATSRIAVNISKLKREALKKKKLQMSKSAEI